ncbi:hypothetical protein GCM10009860_13580 [Microbacterium mitrae]|uniref:Major facilitator superfamily (MFS) profile domain-containing protein n=1 Tax=Microbacterium mitrae TaxID=664640 RepID=A0A5C8HKY5_9MICO|nr:hypothetical protein [Microbacterium mitrae]TXK03536.1 hypothetical protein FVP60_11745 [Microbacterium mitrae]
MAWVAAVEAFLLMAITGVILTNLTGVGLLLVGILGLAVLGICATAMLTLVRTERQVRLRSKTFVFAVGWSHSFSAAGALLGTWLGLGLGVADDPTAGLMVSASLAAIFAVACAVSARTNPQSK